MFLGPAASAGAMGCLLAIAADKPSRAGYEKGGKPNNSLDEKIKPLKLTDGDKKDLVALLKSLNGEGWQKVTAPASFPQ